MLVETSTGTKQPQLTSMPDNYSNASGDSDPDPDMDSGPPNGKLVTIFKKYQHNDTNSSQNSHRRDSKKPQTSKVFRDDKYLTNQRQVAKMAAQKYVRN